ncbi:MAG TPA: response regulator [Chloroflexia bacterium]|nr:response regulator [Chloroflexia bacterium]
MSNTVLVIEDEKSIRDLLVSIFEDEEFRVVAAGTAEEAIGILSSLVVDIITLDLSLPGMNGNEFLVRLGEIIPDAKVVVISATPDKLKATKQVFEVIAKPFDIDRLLEVIRKWESKYQSH